MFHSNYTSEEDFPTTKGQPLNFESLNGCKEIPESNELTEEDKWISLKNAYGMGEYIVKDRDHHSIDTNLTEQRVKCCNREDGKSLPSLLWMEFFYSSLMFEFKWSENSWSEDGDMNTYKKGNSSSQTHFYLLPMTIWNR